MILYRATNRITGKSYIGATSRKLNQRIACHFSDAKKRRKEGSAFHDAIRSYGREAFSFEQIASATDWPSLLAMERVAVEIYATVAPSGYNLSLGGEGALGLVKSAATREKIAAANRGRKHSPETIAKIAAGNRGKSLSAHARAALVSANRGKKFSPERRAAMSAARKGKGPPAEHMERLRKLAIGRECKQETRDKMAAAQRGRPGNRHAIERAAAACRGRKLTDEHKAKIVRQGAAHGMARLTEAQVVAIRAARARGETLKAVGDRHGVSLATVHSIAKRKIWAHVP